MIINTVFTGSSSSAAPKRFALWQRSPIFVRLRGLGEPHRAERFTSSHR